MLENGHTVIVDEVYIVDGSFDEWRETLSEYSVLYVGLKANTDILEKREQERSDRIPGSARAQNMMIYHAKEYDLEFDTEVVSIDECARQIQIHIECMMIE